MPTLFDPSQLNYQLGTYLVGKMGVGKSTALAQIVCHAVEEGWGCCVLDPHGDLVDDLLELIPVERQADVVVVDYRDEERPAGFDIFAGTSLSTPSARSGYIAKVVDAFKKLWGDSAWGPRMEDLLRVIAITFMDNPGTTMRDIERLLVDERFRRRCVRNIQSQTVRIFWEQFDQMTPAGQRQQIDSTMNKVRAFLTNPVLERIVGQQGKVLDAAQAMRNREIVLLCLPERILGEQGVDFLGTLYLSRLRSATQQRMTLPREERTPFVIALDEFHRFAGPDIPSFLAEARKAGVGLVMAHQWRGQIRDVDVRQAPMAASNYLFFQVTPEDATSLARVFRYLPDTNAPLVQYEPSPWEWLQAHHHTDAADALVREIEQLIAELPPLISSAINEQRGRYAALKGELAASQKYMRVTPENEVKRAEVVTRHMHEYLAWYLGARHREEPIRDSLELLTKSVTTSWCGATEIAPTPIDPEHGRGHRLVAATVALGDLLAREPITHLVPVEPAGDGSKTAIATSLMSLPRYTAHCKFVGEEVTVQTVLPHHPLMAIDQTEVRERSAARLFSPLPEPEPVGEEPVRPGPPKRYG